MSVHDGSECFLTSGLSLLFSQGGGLVSYQWLMAVQPLCCVEPCVQLHPVLVEVLTPCPGVQGIAPDTY